MDKINSIIGENLKRIRAQKGLSLDSLAGLSGVSKSMLGQIERGESNPTINVIKKISNGMKVSFTQLVREQMEGTMVVSAADMDHIETDEGRYRVWPIFPFDEAKGFEIYIAELDASGVLDANPHGVGTVEYISVLAGTLTMSVGSKVYTLASGDSIKFDANLPHRYSNNGEETIKLTMIIYYDNF